MPRKPFHILRTLTLALIAGEITASYAENPPDTLPSDEQPKQCFSCDIWNQARTPFRGHGNTWYIGPEGLSIIAVLTTDGLVILDAALPQSVALLQSNLTQLDLNLTDTRYLLTSHAHYDHIGGLAALQRLTHATIVTTPIAEPTLRSGHIPSDDPQAGSGQEEMAFPPVSGPIQTIRNQEQLVVGNTTFTAITTPGHTPGGLSWTWQSCENDKCINIVYADSLNPVSADGYHYLDHPEVIAQFQQSIAKIESQPCDILISVHPSFSEIFQQAEKAEKIGSQAFIDPKACQTYAHNAEKRLKQRLRQEKRE